MSKKQIGRSRVPEGAEVTPEDIDLLIADIDRLGEENEELKERMEVIDRHLEWAYMAIKAKEISAARVSISNARMIAAGMTEEEMLKAVAGDGL